ncbi:netrin receptor unc5b [Plakobranchus ocellatus]|uniref:Netrin receptor unc5b n=1 Tax=Plakobranchus ocellatus TaxID=259542 RepID=A0AAV4DHF5_9GAST|nr:netrin receptor unc5b [Plakobranchus ocellatus]
METEDLYEGADDGFFIKASIEVPRSDVMNYQKQQESELAASGGVGRIQPFWCQCSVLDVNGDVAATSRTAIIRLAYLKRRFTQQPKDTLVRAGENAELLCGAPHGAPTPEIFWRRDSSLLDVASDPHLLITDRGSLVIRDVDEEDVGTYQCVVKNSAGRRQSKEAQLSVSAVAKTSKPSVTIMDENGQRVEIVKSRSPRQTERVQRPRFTKEPKRSYHVKEGGVAKLDCWAVAVSVIDFRCDGNTMSEDLEGVTIKRDRGSALHSGGGSNPTIIHATMTVSYDYLASVRGRVQCQCIGHYKTDPQSEDWESISSRDGYGRIFQTYIGDSFRREPSDVSVKVGDNAVLTCETPDAAPRAYVNWTKDDAKINLRDKEKYRVHPRGRLTIKNVEMSDAGIYVCGAWNKAGSRRSSPAELTVMAGEQTEMLTLPEVDPDSALFIKDLPAQNVFGDSGKLRMECSVFPGMQMNIRCGRRYLSRDSDFKENKRKDAKSGKNVLTATFEVTAEDVLQSNMGDRYFCQCSAYYLNSTNKWNQIEGQRGYFRVSTAPTPAARYLKRQFQRNPTDVRVRYADATSLSCVPPEGQPKPRVFWMKDGDRISTGSDSLYVVDESGTLHIEYAEAEVEGIYTCMAENSAAQRASMPAQVIVVGKPTPPPMTSPTESSSQDGFRTDPGSIETTEQTELVEPVFVQEPDEVNYIVDEPVNLQCKVIGTKIVYFVCNGEKFMETRTNEGVMNVEGQIIAFSALTITKRDVEATDYNCYCQAEYKDSVTRRLNTTDSLEFSIKRAFIKRRFLQEPQSVGPTLNTDVTLGCRPPLGEPKPEVYWVKNGNPLEQNQRMRILSEGHLVIRRFQEDDQGVYTCIARNLAGSRSAPPVTVDLTLVVDPTSEGAVDKMTPSTGDDSSDSDVETDPDKFGRGYLSKDIFSRYYTTKDKPAELLCEVHYVNNIEVLCYGQPVDIERYTREKAVKDKTGQILMRPVTEAKWMVTFDQVKERVDKGETYECICNATYFDNNGKGIDIESSVAHVEIAYLDEEFKDTPTDVELKEGTYASLDCGVPNGSPQPNVEWFKDDQPVMFYGIHPSGFLIFSGVRKTDAGQYHCVVSNIAGSRTSQKINVTVKDPYSTTVMEEGSSHDVGVTDQGRIISSQEGDDSSPEPETTPEVKVTMPAEETNAGKDITDSKADGMGGGTIEEGEKISEDIDNDGYGGIPEPTSRSSEWPDSTSSFQEGQDISGMDNRENNLNPEGEGQATSKYKEAGASGPTVSPSPEPEGASQVGISGKTNMGLSKEGHERHTGHQEKHMGISEHEREGGHMSIAKGTQEGDETGMSKSAEAGGDKSMSESHHGAGDMDMPKGSQGGDNKGMPVGHQEKMNMNMSKGHQGGDRDMSKGSQAGEDTGILEGHQEGGDKSKGSQIEENVDGTEGSQGGDMGMPKGSQGGDMGMSEGSHGGEDMGMSKGSQGKDMGMSKGTQGGDMGMSKGSQGGDMGMSKGSQGGDTGMSKGTQGGDMGMSKGSQGGDMGMSTGSQGGDMGMSTGSQGGDMGMSKGSHRGGDMGMSKGSQEGDMDMSEGSQGEGDMGMSKGSQGGDMGISKGSQGGDMGMSEGSHGEGDMGMPKGNKGGDMGKSKDSEGGDMGMSEGSHGEGDMGMSKDSQGGDMGMSKSSQGGDIDMTVGGQGGGDMDKGGDLGTSNDHQEKGNMGISEGHEEGGHRSMSKGSQAGWDVGMSGRKHTENVHPTKDPESTEPRVTNDMEEELSKGMTDITTVDGVKPGTTKEENCSTMAIECSQLTPNDVSSCQSKDLFKQCVDNIKSQCRTELSEMAMASFETQANQADSACAKMLQCKVKVEECYSAHIDPVKFSLQNFCSQREDYIHCTHQALETCGTEMDTPAVEIDPSKAQIMDWFQQYCDTLVYNEASTLTSCSNMSRCEILELEGKIWGNSSFWCNVVSKLIGCTSGAVNSCSLDELRSPLQDLHEKSKDIYCHDPMIDTETMTPVTGEDEKENETDDSNEDEKENETDASNEETKENGEETSAEATKQKAEDGDEDGSSAVSVSLLLTLALQLLVAAILSRR